MQVQVPTLLRTKAKSIQTPGDILTPQEQTELDEIKQSLRLTEKALSDAKGRIKAVELDNYQTKREAQQTVEQANALKAETEAALITAATQLKTAHAIACGLFGMAELCRAYMARKVSAARCLHREMKTLECLQQFVDAHARKDNTALNTVSEAAKQRIATTRADGEARKSEAIEASLGYGYKTFETVFTALVQDGEA